MKEEEIMGSTPLLSSKYDIEENEIQEQGKCFKVRRFFIFLLIVFCDLLVYFYRACPTVVGDDMARDYGIDSSKLGIFSSMFYYPYAVMQPFAGLLADVTEPSFLIAGSSLMAAIGSIMCGLSTTLNVGCIGRFLVGFGSGPVYCPGSRIIINWFPLSKYAKMTGIYVFIAGCGALLAQSPLALLANEIGWRWCFHFVSIIGIALSVLTLVFVRGNPISYGYKPVNSMISREVNKMKLKEKVSVLLNNFKNVVSLPSFWFVALYCFFNNGAFYNVNGNWACQYLMDVFGYEKVTASNILISLSVGTNFGSLVLPYLFEIVKSKKWTVVVGTVVAILSVVPFVFFPHRLNIWTITILFGVFSTTTAGLATTAYPMLTEYFKPTNAGTAIGCVNGFAFLSSAAFMPITGLVLERFGHVEGTNKHLEIGYRYGLWVLNLAALVVSLLFIIASKDPRGAAYQQDMQETQSFSTLQ